MQIVHINIDCSVYEKHALGRGKKEAHPYGLIVGRIVKKKGKGNLPFKQVQRMSWKCIDVDASKLAGKCRPDEWKEWSKMMQVYNASKIGPKDTPPEMLEFVPIDQQEATVDSDVEIQGEHEGEDDLIDSDKQPPATPTQLKHLKCPDYFFKTDKVKRESKKPQTFVEEFASPKVRRPKVCCVLLLQVRIKFICTGSKEGEDTGRGGRHSKAVKAGIQTNIKYEQFCWNRSRAKRVTEEAGCPRSNRSCRHAKFCHTDFDFDSKR